MTLAERSVEADGLVATACGHRVVPGDTCRWEGEAGPFLLCKHCCTYCSPGGPRPRVGWAE